MKLLMSRYVVDPSSDVFHRIQILRYLVLGYSQTSYNYVIIISLIATIFRVNVNSLMHCLYIVAAVNADQSFKFTVPIGNSIR